MTASDIAKVWQFSTVDVNDYYADICRTLMEAGTETSPRGKLTKELHPTTALILQPRKRVMTCFGRVINFPFALVEAIQIITGQNDAQALSFYNSSIIGIQGDGSRGTPHWELGVTRFNAAYGERMREFEASVRNKSNVTEPVKVDQLEHVIQTLVGDPDSRQASIVLSHPAYDNYTKITRDRACNVYAHAMIRDGKLDWMQIIRSNDAVWGIPYNIMQWSHVQEWVAASLHVQMGHMFIVQDSFHVYEDFYQQCEDVKPFDLYQYFENPPLAMEANAAISTELFLAERNIRNSIEYHHDDFKRLDNMVGPYWRAVIQVLQAYREFKQGYDDKAFETLPEYAELRAPMLRQFCHYRWNKNPEKYTDLIQLAYLELSSYGVPYEQVRKWLGTA